MDTNLGQIVEKIVNVHFQHNPLGLFSIMKAIKSKQPTKRFFYFQKRTIVPLKILFSLTNVFLHVVPFHFFLPFPSIRNIFEVDSRLNNFVPTWNLILFILLTCFLYIHHFQPQESVATSPRIPMPAHFRYLKRQLIVRFCRHKQTVQLYLLLDQINCFNAPIRLQSIKHDSETLLIWIEKKIHFNY